MNFQQIHSFLAVCDTLNFSQAAKLTHNSQSVTSRHIAQMESELGFPLFVRSKHHVALTDSGEVMMEYFSKMMQDYSQATNRANRVSNPGLNHLCIRLLDLFDNERILNVISTFPKTTFHIERYTHPCHAEDLLNGNCDIGIGYRDELCLVPKINYQELFFSRECLVCSMDYRPPKRGIPVLFMVSDDMQKPANISGNRPQQLSLDRYRIHLVPNIASALTAVESGMGYTIVKDFSLPYVRFHAKKIYLNSWQSIGISWIHDPKRPFVQKFAESCIQAFSTTDAKTPD